MTCIHAFVSRSALLPLSCTCVGVLAWLMTVEIQYDIAAHCLMVVREIYLLKLILTGIPVCRLGSLSTIFGPSLVCS